MPGKKKSGGGRFGEKKPKAKGSDRKIFTGHEEQGERNYRNWGKLALGKGKKVSSKGGAEETSRPL